jgi:serine/threonine protein kinase
MVALKVMDVDEHDFKARLEDKDETIEVTLHEIKVLQQLKDSKARNVNGILDAFQMHSQLWIVSEYCPGGSLRTLVSQAWSMTLSLSFSVLWSICISLLRFFIYRFVLAL